MPVLGLCDSAINYALNQIVIISSSLPGMTHITIPWYTSPVLSFTIVIGAMTFLGYFQDFTDGFTYPKRAIVFGVCAIVGLAFFWKYMVNISPSSIGSDAITTAIFEIIIIITSAILSLYLSRTKSTFSTVI
ncbi:MAG: hypothetical protein KGH77_00620 [Candidatus Micrarchaeota archaeon]|nr:hypothetical protein [Candidatus Micrarchaeota archaeon]MDE1863917.1 hypothetical protein [Candidatus Micrarchaeota archaeon]